MSHTCLCLRSPSWYSFSDTPEGWKAEWCEVAPGRDSNRRESIKCHLQVQHVKFLGSALLAVEFSKLFLTYLDSRGVGIL